MARRLLALAAAGVCTLALCISTALLFLLTPDTNAPPAQIYIVRSVNGRAALFRDGEDAPVAWYDVYSVLLPAQDAAALEKGVRVQGRAAALRLLEDLGA